MLFLRAVFLEFLLCTHVIGAAVLFRRLFPRESAWFCYLVPTLGLLITLNFIEYFVPLKNLGWLLPITLSGMIWTILRPGYSWDGLRFPTILFVGLFTFTFAIKCIWPEISNSNEAIFNMTRVLNYSLSDTLPPKDVWMPPYDYGAYYSFQHYGAAILMRLFSVDLGTAYNVSFAFLLAWLCLMGAGVAHAITGKIWVALAMVLVLLASSTGSVPYILLFNIRGADYGLSTNLNADWNIPANNPFSWLAVHDKYHPTLILQAPLIDLYWPEYHSTLGGNFITIAAMLAAVEVFKPGRYDWSWICVVILPLVAVITSAWFFFVIFFLCGGSLILALCTGSRPQNWRFVVAAGTIAAILLWPFFYGVMGSSSPVDLHWTMLSEHTPFWMFVAQWWPVVLPWLLLCCIRKQLDIKGRWFLVILPLLFIAVEMITFGERKLTTEKIWAGIYGASLVTLLPMLFTQVRWTFRLVTVALLINAVISLDAAFSEYYNNPLSVDNAYFRLQGDAWVRGDSQKRRILEVLRRYHGANILPGKSYWNYSQAAAVISFSENMCYVAYTINEHIYGRGEEVEYRNQVNNEFYEGKLAGPLSFLNANNIDAVLIWPEDNISDDLLARFKTQLGPEFFYIDCKMDEPNNAGLFVRQEPLKAVPPGPGPAAADSETVTGSPR